VTERCFRTAAGAEIRLRQLDCLEGLAALAPGSVDAVVTSPPYNLGIGYSGYDDDAPRAAYLEWTDRWVAAVAAALAPEGSLFLNVAGKPTDPMVPFEVLGVAARHLKLQNVIHWIKSIAIAKEDVGNYPGVREDLALGHYKPINSSRYLNDCHEYVFHLTYGGAAPLDRLAIGVPYRDKSNVSRWAGARGDAHCRGNCWFIPYPTIQRRASDRPHPATFPPKLPELCFRLHGMERVRLALDPFLGIGSTARACVALGLSFIGYEISPEYFGVACEAVRGDLGLFGAEGEGDNA
jgi:site-specific DNA-methyltransferase (adenine-specific)